MHTKRLDRGPQPSRKKLRSYFYTNAAISWQEQEQEQERSPGYILPAPLQFIYTTRSWQEDWLVMSR